MVCVVYVQRGVLAVQAAAGMVACINSIHIIQLRGSSGEKQTNHLNNKKATVSVAALSNGCSLCIFAFKALCETFSLTKLLFVLLLVVTCLVDAGM